MKLNILIFLEKAIRITYKDMLEDTKDQICPIVMKVIEEKDPSARDQALKVIGVMAARLDENAM